MLYILFQPQDKISLILSLTPQHDSNLKRKTDLVVPVLHITPFFKGKTVRNTRPLQISFRIVYN